MVRVECLYRVSTKGQVDHDDIPMQRIECRKFAADNGWTIIKELQEKGVSGFKVSANDRDAIQELREDAAEKRFDVLLVFMFDRLGRRDDETPFVVEWFAKQGIRIFSVKEGEQKFESHTDSLINYIRYWQSEGESKKTSIRIKTRLDQLRAEGLYTGGPVRYGYRAVEKGRLNKKNKPVKDLEIDPAEAAVVKEIFERTVYHGEGSFTLANDLNSRGYRGYLVTKDEEQTCQRQKAATAANEQRTMKMEIGRCLLGRSRFTEEQLSTSITAAANLRKKMEAKVIELEMKIKDQQKLTEGISVYYSRFRGWSAEFRLADTDRKRFIISQLYSRIELHRNYEIRFVLDANYQQFLDGKVDTSVKDFVAKMGRLSAHPLDMGYSEVSA